MKNSEVISVVRDLIQTLEDGKEGFRLAADAIDNSDLKKLFTHYSEQHAQFATDLHNLSNGFGDPAYDQNGSLESTFHRGWLNLRARSARTIRLPSSRSVNAEKNTLSANTAKPSIGLCPSRYNTPWKRKAWNLQRRMTKSGVCAIRVGRVKNWPSPGFEPLWGG